MTVMEKIHQLGKSFPYDTCIVYSLHGNTGRIIQYGITDEREAIGYKKLAEKNGVECFAVRYNHEDGSQLFL